MNLLSRPVNFRANFLETRFAGVVLLLPLAIAFFLHVPRLALDNFTDAVFYLSYARQFSELVSRYGFHYYATRFGGILPDVVSGHLFGEVTGIWLMRWILSSLVSLSLYLAFKKRYGLVAGLLSAALWSLNPAALRLLCTTYVDSTAIPFLIIGCALVASSEGNKLPNLIAGFLFGLSASAHLYAFFALVLLMPWLASSLWEKHLLMLRALIWTMMGFAGAFLLGWLYYAIVWKMPALFSPTMEVMQDLGSGQTALWKKPLATAIRDAPAWIAPLALLPALIYASIRGSMLIRGAALSLLASAGFFWGGDLFGNAYVLSMPFYYSFLLPVMILTSATLCGEIIKERARRSVVVVLAILGIGGGYWLVISTGMFSQMMGHYSHHDLAVIELAAVMRQHLPQASQDDHEMRFWYDDDLAKAGGSDRRMLAAFWLHAFGKLRGNQEGYVSFPQMSPADAEAMRYSGVDRIVIFDQDPARVNAALDDVRAQRLPFAITKSFVLIAPSDLKRTVNLVILEREPHELKNPIPLPNEWQVGCGGKILSQSSTGVELQSGTIKSWDFARLPIGDLKQGELVRITYRVEQGIIRFALTDEKGKTLEHVEKWMMQESRQREGQLDLMAPMGIKNAVITLQSMFPRDARSRVLIQQVEKGEMPITQ